MKYYKILILLLISVNILFAQNKNKKFDWNGYGQFRFYKQNNNAQGFMVRRAKLWVKGNVPNTTNFTYKVMGIFKYSKTGYFGLLDVFGSYNFKYGYLRFGQQIPEFSLQRSQPDWKIPVLERAAIINKLIPSAQSSARDIGLQTHLNFFNKNLQIALGIFNGNGANLKKHSSSNFLYNIRSTYKLNLGNNYYWQIGTSAMYRKTYQSDFSFIFGNNKLYTGNDFRFGFESLLVLDKLEIQTELIKAVFDNLTSYGYYAMATYNFTNKDQVVLFTEQFIDLMKNTNNTPWLNAGYNRLLQNHKLKLMITAGTQFNKNYFFTTQIQIFFN